MNHLYWEVKPPSLVGRRAASQLKSSRGTRAMQNETVLFNVTAVTASVFSVFFSPESVSKVANLN
jgi:hypothetical protein